MTAFRIEWNNIYKTPDDGRVEPLMQSVVQCADWDEAIALGKRIREGVTPSNGAAWVEVCVVKLCDASV